MEKMKSITEKRDAKREEDEKVLAELILFLQLLIGIVMLLKYDKTIIILISTSMVFGRFVCEQNSNWAL